MAEKLIGRFYFELTTNGNLIGEFSNNKATKNFTESADFIDDNKKEDPFLGNYYSTWQEEGAPRFAKLNIEPKHIGIYSLLWTDSKGNKIYQGEAMLNDNMMVGDYREYIGEKQ